MGLPTGHEQGWKRSRYPLQPGFQKATEASKHVKPSSSDQPSQTQSLQAATTMPESPPPTSTPQTEQVGLPKPQLGMSNHHPANQSSESIRIDDDTADARSTSSRSSSLTNGSAGSYHNATTMSPIDEKRQEETEQQHDGRSTSAPRTRSLRRSQRSQRLETRLSRSSMHAGLHSPQSSEDMPDTSLIESVAGKGQELIQETALNLLSVFKHEPSSSTNETEVEKKNKEPRLKNQDSALPATPPLSESEPDDKTSFHHRQNGTPQPAKAQNQVWRSRRYPLQTPSQGPASQRPPTPPSPSRKLEPVPLESLKPHSAPNPALGAASNPNLHTYPLQSPVSTENPQNSSEQSDKAPVASDSAKVEQESVTKHKETPTSPATQKKTGRRKAYPLQASASIADLKAASSGSNQTQEENKSRLQSKVNPLPQARALRQGKYPLQSSAHDSNSHQSQPSPGSGNATSAPPQKEQGKDGSQGKAARRRGYPLQAPISSTNLRDASSSVEGHSTSPQPPRNRHSVTIPQSPLSQRYPLQPLVSSPTSMLPPSSSTAESESSSEDYSSRRYPPPPYLREERRSTSGSGPKFLLPKNLRAVKNSDQTLKGRTIVVCLDGTGDKFDDDNSNIVHLVSALKKDDSHQVTYYQAGIGTYNDGGLSSGFASALDMAVGSGLGLHVRDAYRFLMHSYKEGDRICIFGFSRGAYTARCLAGMVHKVGLLPPRNIQQIQFAYEFYKDDSEHGWKQSEDFKRAFSIEVNIHFIGCFDSVASVGFIPRQLPLSSTPNSKARYFRHAMALDERRAKFKICRYQSAKKQGQPEAVSDSESEDEEATTTTKMLAKVTNAKDQKDTPPKYSPNKPYGKGNHPNMTEAEYDRLYGHEDDFDTDVSEVWFAGCHADVGGGAVANVERHKLAQIPLRWMIRQAFECNTGIIFKTRMLAEFGLDVHSLWPVYGRLEVPGNGHPHSPPSNFLSKYDKKLPPRSIRRSKLVPVERRGEEHDHLPGLDHSDHHGEPWFEFESPEDEDWTPEQVEDYYDAMTQMNDQLVQAPTWWILEALPVQYKMCYEPGKVVTVTGPNMGLARLVEDHDAQIHWTVLQRARKLGYKAAARPAKHTEWRVVA